MAKTKYPFHYSDLAVILKYTKCMCRCVNTAFWTQNDFFLSISLLFLILPFPPNLSFYRYDNTFELYSESERLYLFGTDDPDSHKEWVKSIAKVNTKYISGGV